MLLQTHIRERKKEKETTKGKKLMFGEVGVGFEDRS